MRRYRKQCRGINRSLETTGAAELPGVCWTPIPRRAVRLGACVSLGIKRTPAIPQHGATPRRKSPIFRWSQVYDKKSSRLREVEIPKTQAWFSTAPMAGRLCQAPETATNSAAGKVNSDDGNGWHGGEKSPLLCCSTPGLVFPLKLPHWQIRGAAEKGQFC